MNICCKRLLTVSRHVNKLKVRCIWSSFDNTNRNFKLDFSKTTIPTRQSRLQNMATSAAVEQIYDYFLVLDFEATCDDTKQMKPQEIIEFPVLKINAKTLETESIFHYYVEPTVHKQLTPFCTELTGIIQDMIEGQPDIETVLKLLDKWMLENGLLEPNVKSVFVTCGDWDLKTMLPSQCRYFNIPVQKYLKTWVNIKRPFSDVTGTYPKGMMSMLNMLNLAHQGRHHSGIDDCKNIGQILCELVKRGKIIKATGSTS